MVTKNEFNVLRNKVNQINAKKLKQQIAENEKTLELLAEKLFLQRAITQGNQKLKKQNRKMVYDPMLKKMEIRSI